MNGVQKIAVILGVTAAIVASLVGLQNIQQHEKEPDTLTGYTQHLCSTRGGEWLRSPQYGYMCKVQEMHGRFENGYSWYQFFYSVEDHVNGQMRVEMMKLTGSPDSPYVTRHNVPVAIGYFTHKGGNHNE